MIQSIIFDLDGTISKRDTFKEILIFGLISRPWRIFLIPFSIFDLLLFLVGVNTNTLVKERLLKRVFGNISKKKLNSLVKCYKYFFLKRNVYSDAVQAILDHQNNNDHIILATASFDFYVEKIVSDFGFDKVICTIAEEKGDRLTGLIDGQNCFSQNKLKEIKKHICLSDYTSIVCYTDHHADLPLINECDLAYLVNPTKKLKNLIDKTEGYKVVKWN